MHAFYERLRARKGHNAAVVAVARKLAVLFYCMLTREQDYAHQQPSLTAHKLRRLEVKAGAPTVKGKPTGVCATREKMRHAEKQLAEQAEASYKRLLADCHATVARERQGGRERDSGARIIRPSKGKSRGRLASPRRLHFDTSSARAHNTT